VGAPDKTVRKELAAEADPKADLAKGFDARRNWSAVGGNNGG
jgi:hypothetical protein